MVVPGGVFSSEPVVHRQGSGTAELATFCLDRTEVTAGRYAACVAAGACSSRHLNEWTHDGVHFTRAPACNHGARARADHPMNCVAWTDARDYCEWVGRRLPGEHEWEWAARGRDQARRFPWGDAPARARVCGGRTESSCPVGRFPGGQSRDGALDLAGNVWEWTATRVGRSESAVYRGGGWNNGVGRGDSLFEVALRNVNDPRTRGFALGFRCAADPSATRSSLR